MEHSFNNDGKRKWGHTTSETQNPLDKEDLAALSTKKRRIWLWLFISTIIVVLAVILLLSKGLDAKPVSTGGVYQITQPLLYRKDGKVYMTNDKDTVLLDDMTYLVEKGDYQEENKYNIMLDSEGEYLYYLADVSNGLGKLMKVSTDCVSKPTVIADNVGSAVLSNDGKSMLFMRSIEGDFGKLCHYKNDDFWMIENRAYKTFYGFSPNGKYYYYYVAGSSSYISSANLIARAGKQKTEVNLTFFYVYKPLFMGNDGTVVYIDGKIKTDLSTHLLYNGKKYDTGLKCTSVQTLNDNNEFICITLGNDLYYVAPGKEAEKQWSDCIKYMYPEYLGGNPEQLPEKRWLIVESKASDLNNLVLYEQTLGHKPVKVTNMQKDYVEINDDFSWIKYQQHNCCYLRYKTETGWSGPIRISSGFRHGFFDPSGKYYYFKRANHVSEMWRFSLEDMTTETVVQKNVRQFQWANNRMYMQLEDGTLCCEQGDGEVVSVCKDAEILPFGREISYITESD